MRKRLFIVGIRADLKISCKINDILDFDEYKTTQTLSDFMDKNFEKNVAYTIRCGGRQSPINDKHNWDGYMVDGIEYRLTIEDCLKLQGYDNSFVLMGSKKEQWNQVGNTIPTIFTELICKNINKYSNILSISFDTL